MTEVVFRAALKRIAEHCETHGVSSVSLCFHGGEPTLVGPERVSSWCAEAQESLAGIARPRFVMQTNATLLDDRWISVFRRYDMSVGVSIDGLRKVHDIYRRDFAGKPTHGRVVAGIKSLVSAGVDVGLLCVIPLGANPLETHAFLLQLGTSSIAYLLPDHTRDSIDGARRIFGDTPCADFLIPIFDHWWKADDETIRVRPFWSLLRGILGGNSGIDAFGSGPLEFLFVETDGAIESLDVLRVCENGMANTGANVLRNSFDDLAKKGDFHSRLIFEGLPPPSECLKCPEVKTCGGGYVPHRYSRANGFDNASAWCADILKLIRHIRAVAGVPAEETVVRRQVLQEMGCV